MEQQTTHLGMHASWILDGGDPKVTAVDGERLMAPADLSHAYDRWPTMGALWDEIKLRAAGSNGCNAGRCFSPAEYDAWVRSLNR